jgi:phage terminase small subunit
MGRPAKPTRLKVLHGDDKKNPQRINRNEPVPQSVEPVPPFKLSKEAQEVWDRQIVPRVEIGLVKFWDEDDAAFFCEAIVATRKQFRAIRKSVKGERGGPSPMGELKKAVDLCAKLGGPLGWTPSDRTKLTVGEESEGDSEDLLTG